jgi:hypothetical protein
VRGRELMATTIVVVLMVVGTPAQAGGGSWFGPDDSYQVPGNNLTVRTAFYASGFEGTPSDGPFYAYFLPGWRGFDKPGPVPAHAIPLGPIAITPATGNVGEWVASLTFTVPLVESGLYGIDFCNQPCTVEGLGDLYGGSFWVGQTEKEARLLARVSWLERRLDLEARRTRHADTALRRAETELADLQGAEAELAELQEQYHELVGDLRAARAQDEPVEIPEPAARSLPPAAWAVGLAALVVGAFVRRRLGRPAVPDVVPDELVRQVEAQVPERQPMTSLGRPAMSMPAPPLTKS